MADSCGARIHFGAGSDGLTQAAHFLSVVNSGPETLPIVDFEATSKAST